MKWALVLSGGGMRGVGHIGVVKAFEEAGLKPNLLVGVSAGSIVAGMYGMGLSAKEMAEIAKSSAKQDFFDPDWKWGIKIAAGLLNRFVMRSNHTIGLSLPPGIFCGGRLEAFFRQIWGEMKVDDLKLPTILTAVDIPTGQYICFSGENQIPREVTRSRKFVGGVPIYQAVRSSCSLPGLFAPYRVGEMQLVDGGVRNNAPIDIARSWGAEKVVCVNLRNPGENVGISNNFFNVLMRSIDVMGLEVDLWGGAQKTDIMICPPMGDIGLFDFHHIDEGIDIGYQSAHPAIPALVEILTEQPPANPSVSTTGFTLDGVTSIKFRSSK